MKTIKTTILPQLMVTMNETRRQHRQSLHGQTCPLLHQQLILKPALVPIYVPRVFSGPAKMVRQVWQPARPIFWRINKIQFFFNAVYPCKILFIYTNKLTTIIQCLHCVKPYFFPYPSAIRYIRVNIQPFSEKHVILLAADQNACQCLCQPTLPDDLPMVLALKAICSTNKK